MESLATVLRRKDMVCFASPEPYLARAINSPKVVYAGEPAELFDLPGLPGFRCKVSEIFDAPGT